MHQRKYGAVRIHFTRCNMVIEFILFSCAHSLLFFFFLSARTLFAYKSMFFVSALFIILFHWERIFAIFFAFALEFVTFWLRSQSCFIKQVCWVVHHLDASCPGPACTLPSHLVPVALLHPSDRNLSRLQQGAAVPTVVVVGSLNHNAVESWSWCALLLLLYHCSDAAICFRVLVKFGLFRACIFASINY